MNDEPIPIDRDLQHLEPSHDLGYDDAVQHLNRLESPSDSDPFSLSHVNLVIRILTTWPLNHSIDRRCLRLLCRYSERCASIREQALLWADHPDGIRRLWAASLLPAIEPDHPKVIQWLEAPELDILPIEQAWQVDGQRDRVIRSLLQVWPKSKIAKGHLLAISQQEQNVELAAEVLCLEPICPLAAKAFLACIGMQDPYHERDHEILGASYAYLRTTWPAYSYREQVIAALRRQLSLAIETLKPWITPDKHGHYHSSSRQMMAACRILWDLRHDEKPIALALSTFHLIASALGTLLSDRKTGRDNPRFMDLAALELLAEMGPYGVASLPDLAHFATTNCYRVYPDHVLTTLVAIGSKSEMSLAVIINAMKLPPSIASESGVAQVNETYMHAGRALATLFGVDSRFSKLLDSALQNEVTRSQFIGMLGKCQWESIANEVELFLTKLYH